MTIKEVEEAIEILKQQGNNDEDIAASFYLMYVDNKIDINQFKALLAVLGYKLVDDFEKLSEKEQRKLFIKKDN